MKKQVAILMALVLMGSGICQAQKPVKLFNEKNLRGWTPYLKAASREAKREFRVKNKVICLSGEYGYIRTDKVYKNYELKVEWRWPGEPSNSGIFLHVQDEFKVWPTNFECQLWTGKAGDIYCAGEAGCDQSRASKEAVVPKQLESNERPAGEWNNARILCTGDTIIVYINGQLQNEVTGLSHTQGYIGLQSEGKPVEFRNVVLTPVPRPEPKPTPEEKKAAKDAERAEKAQFNKEYKEGLAAEKARKARERSMRSRR